MGIIQHLAHDKAATETSADIVDIASTLNANIGTKEQMTSESKVLIHSPFTVLVVGHLQEWNNSIACMCHILQKMASDALEILTEEFSRTSLLLADTSEEGMDHASSELNPDFKYFLVYTPC